jgi:GxxExxY protein
MKNNPELILKDECHQVMGACFEVYKDKGYGFLEAVYQECLELELQDKAIPVVAQPELVLAYKGRPLKQTYRPDLICYGSLLVELKAVSQLADEHRAQVINYLHATGLRVGLLVNFGHHPRVEWERIVL